MATPRRLQLIDSAAPEVIEPQDHATQSQRIEQLATYSRQWRWLVVLVWAALLAFVLAAVGISAATGHEGVPAGTARQIVLGVFAAGVSISTAVGVIVTALIASDWMSLKRKLSR